MSIHREGYVPLLTTAVVLLILNLLVIQFLTWPPPWPTLVHLTSTISFFMILQFFRNPKVNTVIDDRKVYAPANGKVVVIEETHEPEYFNQPRKQISIFMSPVDVHVNRNPVSGIIKILNYHAGKYLVAWHPKSSMENAIDRLGPRRRQSCQQHSKHGEPAAPWRATRYPVQFNRPA